MAARPRTEDAILGDLGLVTSAIDEHKAALDKAYARRLALLSEARALDPPVTHRRLAAIAGVSEVALIRQLAKAAASS